MNRRGFFSRLFGSAAATTTLVTAIPTKENTTIRVYPRKLPIYFDVVPFCPKCNCYIIRMDHNEHVGRGSWFCPNCDYAFEAKLPTLEAV